jgi:hypothetical protein
MEAELWEMLGEPSDLDPTVFGSAGELKLRRWLNEGQRRIAGWKFPEGHIIRFPCLYKQMFWQAVVKTGTLQGGSTTSVIFAGVDTQIGTEDDRYNGWRVEVTGGTGAGQSAIIVDFAGGGKVGTLNQTWGTAPDGTSTYSMTKKFALLLPAVNPWASEHIQLSPVSDILDIMKIEDVEDLVTLDEGDRTESFIGTFEDVGTPVSWIFFGNQIIFDVAPDASRWFKIEYYKQPIEMVAASDTPEIPDAWHEGIVLWARWWGFARGQETAMAYSSKKDFNEFLQNTRQSLEMRYERTGGQASPEV